MIHTMNFHSTHYHSNTVVCKLQASSLKLHQSLKTLFKSRYLGGLVDEDIVRRWLIEVRADPVAFLTWQLMAYRQCTYLEETAHVACLLHYRLLTASDSSLDPTTDVVQAFPNFWRQLFDHLLELAFIHPQLFMEHHEGFLGRAIELVRNSWHDFVVLHVKCSFEQSCWTEVNVRQYEQQHQQHQQQQPPSTQLGVPRLETQSPHHPAGATLP